MSIRLGYFPQFEGNDTVLVSCDSADVGTFRALLTKTMSFGALAAIHDIAEVSARHPARVWVYRLPASQKLAKGDFSLSLDPTKYLEVDAKLEALQNVREGHQYFELSQPGVDLMVSVGEYSNKWWEKFSS